MSDAPEAAPAPEPAFDDSRRLMGANRTFAGTGTTLTPRGPAARDPAAHQRWAARMAALARALGWPDPQAQARVAASEVQLLAAAPPEVLLTATELSEWAWERTAAEADAAAYAAFGIAQPLGDDLATAAAEFARRAARERNPALAALIQAAQARGLPVLCDDEQVSLGAGHRCRVWPLAALPSPGAVPWGELGPVPTALVTGSNGKTTSVRLVAAMLKQAGWTPGLSSTTGVEVDGRAVAAGDYAGPAGARAVLRHPGVSAAVLETARGGILRRGLAVPRADAALVTNISADHFGEYGIDSLADLAEVKLVVARALDARGTLVLNADDAVLMAGAARLPHAASTRKALFAERHDHPALRALRQHGGSTCGLVQRGRDPAEAELVLTAAGPGGGVAHGLGRLAELPLTLAGAARHNVANLAGAALVALALGVPVQAIEQVARRFGEQPQDNPGRLERWPWRGATVLVDYAHNPDGLARLLEVARALQPRRLWLLLGQAGNRSNEAIAELARTAARFQPDRVVLKDMGEQYLRGRALGEVPALLHAALRAGGVPVAAIETGSDEALSARRLLEDAAAGDVVVLPLHEEASRRLIGQHLRGQAPPRGAGA